MKDKRSDAAETTDAPNSIGDSVSYLKSLDSKTPIPLSRELHPGMGKAVAERTVLRKKSDGEWENWSDVATRVAMGNVLLSKEASSSPEEFLDLRNAIAKAGLLMSGRHLQHGDITQPTRNMEVFTNCATSPTSFLLFYLLLNGSGVGRCYDDEFIVVNWDHAPAIRCVIDDKHPDFDILSHESLREAKHKYGSGKDVMWFEVPDTREGWAKAVELWENAAFEKIHRDKMLIIDFSNVRCKGSPINGMQNRPASGPVPLMNALHKASMVKGANLAPWLQAMFIDHYLAECVLVGGARRAARMSTKFWRNASVLDFIQIKRPIEYRGKSSKEVTEYRQSLPFAPMSFLWSSNNSVCVDSEFWELLALRPEDELYESDLAIHARKVFDLQSSCAYGDGTGEPGLINVHKLVQKDDGWEDFSRGDFVGSDRYTIEEDTLVYMSKLSRKAKKLKYHTITNPCGEIALNVLGGFCVIADVVPFHADTLEEAENYFRIATRALIRVNSMPSIYSKEVKRTNRIGVGMTGVHEFAWKFFQLGFEDLVDEKKSQEFWLTLNRFHNAVVEEAKTYSAKLGMAVPHTMLTIKPAGTTSKLFGLTEGWHLPSMAFYLRWVQFRNDDPLITAYEENGYPVRKLKTYEGTTIVGFPTMPVIGNLNMQEKLVLAGDALPEHQYEWLRLGEMYFINGIDDNGNFGNQISYTLKYKPEKVTFKHFRGMMRKYQPLIRCASVMPQEDASSYEYQPEQGVTKVEFESISQKIRTTLHEDVDKVHIDCSSGACPIDFKK
jgi:hypothetical protein